MPKELQGDLNASGMRFALVISRFNSLVTEELLKGAMDSLTRHGANPDDQLVVWAPGGWELPLTVRMVLATQKNLDGVIVLGCVMKGATTHNEYIAAEVAKGLAQAGLETKLPVTFGVLTPNSVEQALERSGLKMGNKGSEAANAAIEMVSLIRKMA